LSPEQRNESHHAGRLDDNAEFDDRHITEASDPVIKQDHQPGLNKTTSRASTGPAFCGFLLWRSERRPLGIPWRVSWTTEHLQSRSDVTAWPTT
jgi:hypothetical protein